MTTVQVEIDERAAAMRINTIFAGTVEITEDQVITFQRPLVGFEGSLRYVILQTKPGPLYWLQSLDDQRIAFCVLAPFEAGMDPDYAIGPEDALELGAGSERELVVYTLVVLDPDPARIRTNLRAPILIGRSSRMAKQVVLDDPALPIQFYLHTLGRQRIPGSHAGAGTQKE